MISQWFINLNGLPEASWETYVFSREPLVHKLTKKQRHEFYEKSAACGVQAAKELRDRVGVSSIWEYAIHCGVSPCELPLESADSCVVFARFRQPNEITIYTDNAVRTDAIFDAAGLRGIAGHFETKHVLLAHEIYHFLENTNPDIYTLQKHLTLWKLGPYAHKSSIRSLGEIGAMAFAKELCGLSFNPYVLDVMMLFSANPQQAERVYSSILAGTPSEGEIA